MIHSPAAWKIYMPAKKLGANISQNPQFKPIRRMGKVVAQGWGRRWGRPGGWLGGWVEREAVLYF